MPDDTKHPLRRKGQGKTQRPTCPVCQKDMKRSSIRLWNPKTKKGRSVANGWECEDCQKKIWDKKEIE